MKKSEDFRTRITRRGVLKGAAAIGLILEPFSSAFCRVGCRLQHGPSAALSPRW